MIPSLLSAVAAVCVEALQRDAAAAEVVVRYPYHERPAIIRQSKGCQAWHVAKWLDEAEAEIAPRKRVTRKVKCPICKRPTATGAGWKKHQEMHRKKAKP